MRAVFQQELQDVQDGLVQIADLVVDAIDRATAAFSEADVALAETVISEDRRIDELTRTLDELAVRILARQQPVASDLRIVVSALRISASLERMGDLAEHIAELARDRYPKKAAPKALRPAFAELGRLDVAIARKTATLLRTQDLALAEEIIAGDDAIDRAHAGVFETVLGADWKRKASRTVDAALASRYHERFADHAVGIARKVQYLAGGDAPVR